MAAAKINQGAGLQRQWARTIAAYGAFALACITLLHPTFLDMVSLWAGSSSWRHGFFVAPIALLLVWRRRHETPAPAANIAATAFVLAAGLIWLAGRAAGIALIEQFAFVSVLIAGAVAIFGLAVIRTHAFALAFLYLMVPFGEIFLPTLQSITAQSVTFLLQLTGVIVQPDDYLIKTTAGVFNIAAACAGLNFLLAAIMASLLVSFAWFERWQKRLGFIAFAVIAAIAANIARVYLIILLAGITPEEWRIASDHFAFGLTLYVALIAALLAFGLHIADPSKKQRG